MGWKMSVNNVRDMIDLDRYPVDRLDSEEGQVFLESCREKLIEDGAVVLNGFLKPWAVDKVIADVEAKLEDTFYCSNEHNAYLIDDDPAYPEDHPRNRKVYSDKGILASDQISKDNLLRQVYDWEEVRRFIALLMGSEMVYPFADPLASVNVNINDEGRQLGWHYDNAKFVTTMMLRPAEVGGVYEYVPWTRSEENQNFEELGKILDGESDRVKELKQGVGAFVLFKGKYTVHRVTPVEGDPRLVAILSYAPEPGKMLTEETRRLFYGRTE